MSDELKRLKDYRDRKSNWKHWGPYLSNRSWGSVREDYSSDGEAWYYFPHEHARSRAYRWGEDGIAGISDRNQYLCFAVAFWNGKDPILKERFFGLNMYEGNHGEDVKELFFYLDATPTHSYMKMLYKYPIQEYPYAKLVEENSKRNRKEAEYEIEDTGIFDNQAYFDCTIEYAKADEDDILIKITVENCSNQAAPITILPSLWFRNTWSWGYPSGPMKEVGTKPQLKAKNNYIEAEHPALGNYILTIDQNANSIFTENETNTEIISGKTNLSPYTKDSFHRFLVNKDLKAISADKVGTKSAYLISENLKAKEKKVIKLRLSKNQAEFDDSIFETRIKEADLFYNTIIPDNQEIKRQAYAGLIWNKQLYYYDIEQWRKGDPINPSPKRVSKRNADWVHLTNFDIISMPDKWEFPWYASWDLAFHCIAFARLDSDFAKRQLELMTREWYMHPNGQLPSFEWEFGEVNPPVHAYATLKVFEIDAHISGEPDYDFLEGVFHKLLLNFTWWVNRKDSEGRNVFQGGFLGLDNIGIFDRSAPIPNGGRIDQADGTSWMAAYCLEMMRISIELAKRNPVYQDTASKFLEHFLRVANAMTDVGESHAALWDNKDNFFYDVLRLPGEHSEPIRVRSLVGLIPLFAVDTLDKETLDGLPDFKRRLKWFFKNRQHLAENISRIEEKGVSKIRLVSLLTEDRLKKVLHYMFDENEFLSPYGIRSLSKHYKESPFSLKLGEQSYSIGYEPGESQTSLFGGNSNWRGPIWMPINFILIEALNQYYKYYGDSFKIEFPTGSGKEITLEQAAIEIKKRISKIFVDKNFIGDRKIFKNDARFSELYLFNEYFHGDTGAGLGANHQTGWSALITELI